MGRTLDEDVVLKEIGRWIGYLDEDMIERIKIGIKKLPEAQQWIPCKREQPTIDGKYNVTISGGVFGRYVTDLWYGKPTLPMNGAGGKRGWFKTTPDGDYWYDGVIAWKPIEEPWKGEQP